MEAVLTLGQFRRMMEDLPDYVPIWAPCRSLDDPDEFDEHRAVYDIGVHEFPLPVVVELYVDGLA